MNSGIKTKTIGAILFTLCLSFWTTQSVAAEDSQLDAESPQEKTILKWLGTAGWEIRLGNTKILIDPFLTRREPSANAEWKTDEEAVLNVITIHT
jgi:hypothetical protein